MRDIYHDELDDIGKTLEAMTQLVQAAMERATNALLDGDLAGAERVISEDPHIDALREELEDRTFQMHRPAAAGRHRPAGAARDDASGRRPRADGRPGPACRQGRPDAVPGDRRARRSCATSSRRWAQVALSLVGKVGAVIEGRDVALAQAIEAEDDSMDALHRKLFTLLLSPNWSHGIESAIDMTLLGRYYERYADHAVAAARQVVYIVTGQMPEPLSTGISQFSG